MLGPEEIEHRFGFHKATTEGENATLPKHRDTRLKYREFAEFLDEVLPDGRARDVEGDRAVVADGEVRPPAGGPPPQIPPPPTPRNPAVARDFVVGMQGFEPWTPDLRKPCSAAEIRRRYPYFVIDSIRLDQRAIRARTGLPHGFPWWRDARPPVTCTPSIVSESSSSNGVRAGVRAESVAMRPMLRRGNDIAVIRCLQWTETTTPAGDAHGTTAGDRGRPRGRPGRPPRHGWRRRTPHAARRRGGGPAPTAAGCSRPRPADPPPGAR